MNKWEEIEFCKASIQDIPKIIELWQQVFGDSKEKIVLWLTKFCGIENVFVVKNEEEEVVAQLLGVPCENSSGKKGVYFYALATLPSERGKGIMTKLMEYAENYFSKQNLHFVCLVPATNSLFDFYEMHAYEKTSNLCRTELIIIGENKKTLEEDFVCERIDAIKFQKLRKRYLTTNYLSFNEKQYEIVLDDFYEQGGQVLFSKDGYALFIPEQNKVNIVEFTVNSSKKQKKFLESIKMLTKKEKMVVTTIYPLIIEEYRKKEIRLDVAMQKALSTKASLPPLYVRMVLEELV